MKRIMYLLILITILFYACEGPTPYGDCKDMCWTEKFDCRKSLNQKKASHKDFCELEFTKCKIKCMEKYK